MMEWWIFSVPISSKVFWDDNDDFAGLVDKNQELEGEILNKGIEQGKDLLFEQANTKTLAAELEEISNKKVMCYKNIKDKMTEN